MRRKQDGLTLLEMLAAIAVGTLLIIGLVEMIDTSLEDARGQQAAQQQSQLAAAARRYIAANYADLVTDSASAVVPVTVAQLKTANFLSSGFALTNSYGQDACVLVRQPAAGKLDALVVTRGGRPIPEKNLRAVALSAGQGGGYISALESGTARGASWALDTTPYRAVSCGGGAHVLTGAAADGGRLASSLFYDGPGQLASDFLYRDVVNGRPELNQMRTPLGMTAAALVAAGSPCGASAAIAVDAASRRLLVCGTAGVWTSSSSWKDSVATFADLPPAQHGDVVLVRDIGRAFAYSAPPVSVPARWRALAVDENGRLDLDELNVAERANIEELHVLDSMTAWGGPNIFASAQIGGPPVGSTGSLHVHGPVTADATLTVGDDITAKKNVAVAGDANVAGGVTSLWEESGEYQIRTKFAPGTACNYVRSGDGRTWIEYPTGTVVNDPAGRIMSCYADNTFRYPNGTYMP
ncbi:MAG TPA: shufflon system plasmid conjugative transfer pilus tip adhesin PilV [Noviherbaspirillum sp.]|jgi:type II secretory pathway pseudopilin PulG|uniref:shufflon system plasmid conjugative transfer pilus tip adhesin PilV n=1 Tax=Noviherbaspirillum sp. TaxID=1926288 RepID=UPI002F932492